VKPGYANFAVADPPLKLILVAGGSEPGTLNHIGVEVESRDAVAAANTRFQSVGLVGAVEEDVTCCYAVQDKVWVDGPDNLPWEFYTVLADSETPNGDVCAVGAGSSPEDAGDLGCAAAPESSARCC
jgi:hypothetical protein